MGRDIVVWRFGPKVVDIRVVDCRPVSAACPLLQSHPIFPSTPPHTPAHGTRRAEVAEVLDTRCKLARARVHRTGRARGAGRLSGIVGVAVRHGHAMRRCTAEPLCVL